MLEDDELDAMERFAMTEETLMALNVGKLVSEVRRLKHELADPNYLYVGRIHRQSILCRDAQIDVLRKEIAELKSVYHDPHGMTIRVGGES